MTLQPPEFVSNLLPRDARDALVRAAAIEPQAPAGTCYIRMRAVEDAIARVKHHYPQLFKTD